ACSRTSLAPLLTPSPTHTHWPSPDWQADPIQAIDSTARGTSPYPRQRLTSAAEAPVSGGPRVLIPHD
ncbi:hypothetical protein AB0M76_40345, partial [Streptomyces sp. NPDC051364]